ncbi:hypothetical protein ACFLSF_02290 [Candidatus Bipolaricaulota bacterium]
MPKPNGSNGRDERGRFTKGNPGGPGNPYAAQVGRLRSSLLSAITEDDIRAIVAKLVDQARDGDIAAARVLFTRVFGRPLEADILERIEALETLAEGLECDATRKG